MSLIRHAVAADLNRCTRILVEAFDDDPVYHWMFPVDATFKDALREWFTYLGSLVFPRGHYYRTHDFSAVAMWLPPDVPLVAAGSYRETERILAEYSTEAHARRVSEVIGQRGMQRPAGPSWQLMYVGVLPQARGEGVGSRMLAPILQSADDDGLPVYVNNRSAETLPFFERLGFRLLREFTVEGGPTFYPMYREPQST